MDSILTDQLEWLISGNLEGLRFKRHMVLLAGCLDDVEISIILVPSVPWI